MEFQGFPPSILKLQRQVLSRLMSCFKIGVSWARWNSILQGCGLSADHVVVKENAWAREVQARVPQAEPAAWIDDRTIVITCEEAEPGSAPVRQKQLRDKTAISTHQLGGPTDAAEWVDFQMGRAIAVPREVDTMLATRLNLGNSLLGATEQIQEANSKVLKHVGIQPKVRIVPLLGSTLQFGKTFSRSVPHKKLDKAIRVAKQGSACSGGSGQTAARCHGRACRLCICCGGWVCLCQACLLLRLTMCLSALSWPDHASS